MVDMMKATDGKGGMYESFEEEQIWASGIDRSGDKFKKRTGPP